MLFRIKRFSPTIWTLLALCLPLVACNPWPSGRLKISLSEWPGYEFINLAVAKGFISNAEIVSLTDQSEVVRAYLRGELDVVQLTTVDVLDICSKRPAQCPVIVLVLNESLGGDQIMSLKLGGIDELAGAKVAVAPNSFGPYVLHKALETSDLTIDDLSIVPMLVSEMPEAIFSDVVDAAVLYPPNSEQIRAYGGRTIFDSSKIPGQILDVLAVSPSVYASRKKDISLIVAGWFKAHAYASNAASSAIPIMASSQGLTPDEFKDALSGMFFALQVDHQRKMLAPRGELSENVDSVSQLMRGLNLHRDKAPSPQISADFLP